MNVLIASLTINVRIGFVAFFFAAHYAFACSAVFHRFSFEIVVLRTLFFLSYLLYS